MIDLSQQALAIVFARTGDGSPLLAAVLTAGWFLLLYAVMAGGAFLLLDRLAAAPINARPLRTGQVRSEIAGSLRSIGVFAAQAAAVWWLLDRGWLAVSWDVGPARWALEVCSLWLWNEVHFYATHRLLHWRPLFLRVHAVHHRSVRVTPLAAFNFHWIEAFLLGAVMPLALCAHAFSPWALLCLPALSLAWNVLGHSNWRPRSPAGWLRRASEQHAAHHARAHGNYGFALSCFDRWLGTRL
ncbi:MAG: sterol desaturase family protein [Moraxellaceae bacterium]|nr:sterol desaturase family protein [Moraxellaceae bacterium]